MLMPYFVFCADVLYLSGAELPGNRSEMTTNVDTEGTSINMSLLRMVTQDRTNNVICPPLESLDFSYYNKSNITHVQELENQWICQVQEHWRSTYIQALVSVVRFLFKYPLIVLITIGLIVNICSLFVLSSSPMNKCYMSVYLKALAVSDIGVLTYVTVGMLRARYTEMNNIYLKRQWMCVLYRIHYSLFFYYSTWLVVTFTVERWLMIRNPFKIRTIHNENTAKFTVVILAIVIVGLSLLRFVTTPGFENNSVFDFSPCEITMKRDFEQFVYIVPYMLINNVLPTIFITFANIFLLIHIRESAHIQRKLNATDDKTYSVKVTRIVIIVSIAYVIMFLPFGVSSCADILYIWKEPTENLAHHISWAKEMIHIEWIRRLCCFFYFFNYVNNFFLYCLSGDTFRQTLYQRLPSHIQKICLLLMRRPAVSTLNPPKRIAPAMIPLSSTRTTQSTSIVSETGRYNPVFSISDEETSR